MSHHRRASSYWTPAMAPFVDQFNLRRRENEETRLVVPNCIQDCSRYELPNYLKYKSNEISTTQYNALTFIPLNLWQQFHRLANIFFVFLIVMDCIPLFSAFNSYVSALPVIFIFILTGIKDAIEDLRRRRLDSKVNNAVCHVWDKTANRFRKLKWKHILVGDIVHISNDELIPADLLILRSSSTDGNAFVETSNLDGESNLKHKVVPQMLLKYCGQHQQFNDDMFLLNVACAPPTKDVSDMRGSIELEGRSDTFAAPNTLLRGCRLKNTTFIEGIVIYAGHDTKMMLSRGRSPHKSTHAESKTNKFILICALILVIIMSITIGMRAWWVTLYPRGVPFSEEADPDWLASIGTSLIIYQIMIPLSLYITVELIKLSQLYFMINDSKMYCENKDEAFIARSLSLNEELGQLTHLISDKTGTLTQNKMILRLCSSIYSVCQVTKQPTSAPDHDYEFQQLLINMIVCNTVFVEYSRRRDSIEDEDTPLATNVFSTGPPSLYMFSESDFDEEPRMEGFVDFHYEGESPDEIALVKGARRFGYQLTSRSSGYVEFLDPKGTVIRLRVLCSIPFDTDRKRMSVCVEGDSDDEVIVYTKGADSSMIKPCRGHLSPIEEEDEDDDRSILEKKYSRDDVIRSRVDEFARQGLRTLVMGIRTMKRNEFDDWYNLYKMVEKTRGDKEGDKMLSELADRLESSTMAIGVTAVEDKLQEGVEKSIAKLRDAKIQVWMLTGDKKETAEGVGMACGLFKDDPVLFSNEGVESYNDKDVLISPDQVTDMCSSTSNAIERLNGSSSVLCYRLTPGQKAEIVHAVKRFGGVVAAIGDGANDVPMIQAAHVGIGISGLEGAQASMAADYVLARFSFVSRLIILHGHWNYYRLANSMLYFLYKNIQNVMVTFFIQIYNGWSSGFPINLMYSVLYPIIFTSLQPIVFGVYDQNEKEEDILNDPTTYNEGREGTLYTLPLFLINVVDAFWQAAICYFTMHLYMYGSEHSTQYFGFGLATTMFLSNVVHLLLETRCFTLPVVGINLLCICVHYGYFLAVGLISTPSLGMDYNDLWIAETALVDLSFWCVTFLGTIVSIAPRYIVKVMVTTEQQTHKISSSFPL